MELHAKITLLAEGARGSLTKTLIKKFGLRKDSDPQVYALGLKEVTLPQKYLYPPLPGMGNTRIPT